MKKWFKSLANLHKDESGQGLVEYVLLIALVALAATIGMRSFAAYINNSFNTIGSMLNNAL